MATYDLSDWEFGPLQGQEAYGSALYARNKKTGSVERAYTFDMQTYGGPRYIPESMKAQVEADFAGQTFGNYDTAMAGSEVKYAEASYVYPRSDLFDMVPGIALGVAAGAVGGLAFGSGPLAGAASAEVGASGIAMSSTPASVGEMVSTPALTSFSGPTGTSLLSTEVATATLGVGEGLASGLGGIEFLDGGAASADLGISSTSATTSAASGLSGTDLLLAAQAAPMLMGLAAGGSEMPEMAGAASQDMGKDKPERNPSTANKERAMDLRRAAAERAADAAGAKRFKNEADLLGQTGRTTQRKKAGQQRVVLGY